jgi:hypothetical protein
VSDGSTIVVSPQELDATQAAPGSIVVDPSELTAAPAPKAVSIPSKTYGLSDLAMPSRTAMGPSISSQFEKPYSAVRGPFGEPEFSEASKQRIAHEQVEGGAHIGPRRPGAGSWLEDLESDIRHGTGATAPGRGLHAMGAPGTETGVPPGVAETVGGPFVGPIRVAHGLKKGLGPYAGEPDDVTSELRGINEAVRGAMQTAAPIAAATQPEFIPTMVPYAAAGELAQRGLEKAGVSPDVAELASNVGLLGGGAGLTGAPERAPFGGVYEGGAREAVIGGETAPDYLKQITDRTGQALEATRRAERINAPMQIPKLPEATEQPPILPRPPARTPMEELSAQAVEARRPQEFRQQLTNEIVEGIISRLRDEGLLEEQGPRITDRRAVRPEDVEPYQPQRRFIGGENIPPAVVVRADQVSRLLENERPARPTAQGVQLGRPTPDTSRMLPPAPTETLGRIDQEGQRYNEALARARERAQWDKYEPVQAARPQDISGDSRRVANLAIGRFKNPIEQQFARDVWHSMLGEMKPPTPPWGMTRERANEIRDKFAGISQGDIGGRVPDPQTVYAPDVLEEARAMMEHTHDFLSQQERPGRYFADMGEETSLTGRGPKVPVTGVTSLRGEFPWFANLKESPADLAKALRMGKGANYDRLISSAADHIIRSRAENQSMARSIEPNLEGLADQVRDLDPDLAAFLADAAQGRISNWTETQRERLANIEEKITDARQAIQFGRAIDDLSGEERAGSSPEAYAGKEEAPPARHQEGARIDQAEAPESEAGQPRFASRAREELAASTTTPEQQTQALRTENLRLEELLRNNPTAPIDERRAMHERIAQNQEIIETLAHQEPEGVLPGMGEAVREQQKAAGIAQAERMSREMGRPPESIEGAAGVMERESPLFRGTEASPQSEMFPPRRNEGGFITPELARDLLTGRLTKEAYRKLVAKPIIEKGLGLGDKYANVEEVDPNIAAGLHMLDNAPGYFRAKAARTIHNIIGDLSREQERLFVLMADADSRENLRANHPEEYRQAMNDPAIQEALRKYRPIERDLTEARRNLQGQTLDQDYLRRVYDQYVAGIGQEQAPGSTQERGTTTYDRIVRPQKVGNLSREATAEYHYEHGLHEFGPAFGTKYIGTNLAALRDSIAREFISKATEVKPGDQQPRFITYNGEKYYRPDLAREMREAGQKSVKTYDMYDPNAGVKYPQKGQGLFLGPSEVVRALNDYGTARDAEAGPVRRFLQEQTIGFGFGIPHVANILRRVTQSAPLGALNPEAWVRAWKVAFGKELRERGINGIDDPTFDRLLRQGSITTGEMANLKAYWGGNLNPANWARSLAGIGHKLIFEPGSFGGLGGVDQRARLYIADLVKSEQPDLSDAQIARTVNNQLGDYNRMNWNERQKLVSKFMLFPGWDTSSIRWVIEHPIKTTVPPALLVLMANQVLNRLGYNREEDATDISNVHFGDRSIGLSILRESMARNIERPLLNYAQSRISGESNRRAMGEASLGIRQAAGGLIGSLRPDLTAAIDLAMNRASPFGGQELVTSDDYSTPGRVLPNRALEKQAALVLRHAIPPLDRMLDSDQDIDFRSFAGSNLGLPNYQSGPEQRLKRNAAEAAETSKTLTRLAHTNQAAAREFVKDPDDAAYVLFHRDFEQMAGTLKRIDEAKAAVDSAKDLNPAQKSARMARIDRARQNLLRNADGLDRLLFERKKENRARVTLPPPTPAQSGILAAAGANR